MSQRPHQNRYIYEGLITALAVGGFFIILGLIIVTARYSTENRRVLC
jgi:hypothetical protein